jgi:hypothetical protein
MENICNLHLISPVLCRGVYNRVPPPGQTVEKELYLINSSRGAGGRSESAMGKVTTSRKKFL